VAVEFVRGDGTVLRLESFEPVTDRHFREDNSMVCISSAATNLEAWRAQTDPTEAASTPAP